MSLAQVKDTIMKLISTAKVMVLSIAIIAILIAMVGVINTILTSVWERFQEIGILKTIGAMPWDIFKLIWIETLILCTAGGILGVILALILARVTDVVIRTYSALCPGRRSRAHRPEACPDYNGCHHVHRTSQRHLSGLEGGKDQASGGDQGGGRQMNQNGISIEAKNLTKVYPPRKRGDNRGQRRFPADQ